MYYFILLFFTFYYCLLLFITVYYFYYCLLLSITVYYCLLLLITFLYCLLLHITVCYFLLFWAVQPTLLGCPAHPQGLPSPPPMSCPAHPLLFFASKLAKSGYQEGGPQITQTYLVSALSSTEGPPMAIEKGYPACTKKAVQPKTLTLQCHTSPQLPAGHPQHHHP